MTLAPIPVAGGCDAEEHAGVLLAVVVAIPGTRGVWSAAGGGISGGLGAPGGGGIAAALEPSGLELLEELAPRLLPIGGRTPTGSGGGGGLAAAW